MTKYIGRDKNSKRIRLNNVGRSINIPGGVPFSEFDIRGNVKVGDIIVGLRDAENAQFTFPGDGILDENDNFLFSYESAGDNAVNHLNFVNATTGNSPVIEPLGSDGNIGLTLKSKNNAPINLYTQNNFVNLNGTAPLYGFVDDATFTDASPYYAPSALAVKTYVDNATPTISNLTFITSTDETADLPNSLQLLGTANQITVTNGVLSLPSTLIAPGTFQAATSINIGGAGATVTSISTDGTLAANSDTLLSTQKAIKTYVDTADTVSNSYSYITKTDNTGNLPNSVPLSGLASGFLSNTTTTGVLNPRTITVALRSQLFLIAHLRRAMF